MTALAPVVSWFNASRPIGAIGDASITLGGTHLLQEFFARAVNQRGGGRLSLAVPYVEEDALQRMALFSSAALDDIDLVLITQPHTVTTPAARRLAGLQWYSCEVRSLENLHAKVYVFQPCRGKAVALLGSHNLTAAAATRNLEAGLLMEGGSPVADSLIAGCTEFISDVRRKSRLVYDSFQWPSSYLESGRNNQGREV